MKKIILLLFGFSLNSGCSSNNKKVTEFEAQKNNRIPADTTPTQTECFNKFKIENDPSGIWSALTNDQLLCIEGKDSFDQNFAYLCKEDFLDLSLIFGKYLTYKKKYSEAFERFKSASTGADRMIAQQEMRVIERDWRLLGGRDAVDQRLNELESLRHQCTR